MKIKLWFPVFLWCGVIFILSSIPTLPSPEILWWDFVLKKSAHIIEYGILYFLTYRALTKNFLKQKNLLFTVYCLLFTLFYAISDEYHQSFVPGRHAKLMDVGFDFLGMLISYLKIKKNVDFRVDDRRSKNQPFKTGSAKETKKLAGKILKNLKTKNLICLYGPLGAGKTTFVQGLAKGLGIKKRVISPTFVMVREYKISFKSIDLISFSFFIL